LLTRYTIVLPEMIFEANTPCTRSSKHQANVEQMYSKYTC